MDKFSISIHALREEGDRYFLGQSQQAQDFYPRPPRGGRQQRNGWRSPIQYFYPRPPRGGRPAHGVHHTGFKTDFYPRPPRGGRLLHGLPQGRAQKISIHALREEGDSLPSTTPASSKNFYPRPPRGGRLDVLPFNDNGIAISIHALREEGD